MSQSQVSKAEAAQERSEETRSFVRRVKAPSPVLKACGFAVWASRMMPNSGVDYYAS